MGAPSRGAQIFFCCFLQFVIIRADVFVMPVFHQESVRNCPDLDESEALIEVACMRIALDNRVELQNLEADFFCLRKAIFHKKFADVLAALVFLDSVTCIRNVPAAPHVIRVKDVQSDRKCVF